MIAGLILFVLFEYVGGGINVEEGEKKEIWNETYC